MRSRFFTPPFPFGSALGYLIGGQIQSHYDWRHAFIWAGAPGLLLAACLLPFREPERGEADSTKTTSKPQAHEFLGLFRNLKYMLVVWGYVAFTFALGAFSFWGPTFFEKMHGMKTESADTFFGAVIVFTGLVGTMVGGFAATAWQKRNRAGYAWVLAISILLAVPTSAYALWTPDVKQSMAFLALAIFFCSFPTWPGEHPHHRNRSGESPFQRDGAVHFHDPFVR